ncbi:MAG TPA: hypothetical protein VIG29_13130 [Vicinamibacteria bacterium]|jgi:hypothetical protein
MGAFQLFAAAAVISVLVPNCEPPQGARLGEAFTLELGTSVRIEEADLTLGFEEVGSDSRCPKDVNCIQAGEALVQLSVAAGAGEKTILEFSVPPGGASPAAKFQDLLVTVLELEPQKESEKSIDPSSYVAKVKVVRSEPGR